MNLEIDELEYDTFQVQEKDSNQRLDKYLVSNLSSLSRSYIQNLIKEGYVLVNKNIEKASYLVEVNDEILVFHKNDTNDEVLAENIPIKIVYEDKDIAIIDKEAGMVVHPSAGHATNTLVNALLYHIKDLSTINGVHRPGIVHRLDKDTSGLLVAKNDIAHQSLVNQLKDHSMHRTYVCLVKGVMETKNGTIHTMISRDAKNRLKMAVVDKDGKDSITHFTVLKQYAKYALVECNLETGRTHQIRVHMDFIHHPIINDPLYGINNKIAYKSNQLLHACKLTLVHPSTNKEMTFTSELPTYFKEALASLKE